MTTRKSSFPVLIHYHLHTVIVTTVYLSLKLAVVLIKMRLYSLL